MGCRNPSGSKAIELMVYTKVNRKVEYCVMVKLAVWLCYLIFWSHSHI